MTEDTKNQRNLLLPDRHPQQDFFICDIFDSAPKSDIASMKYPLFSLATKPDKKTREYSDGKNWLKISPSNLGLATVHDRDILIYCISQCMNRINKELPVYKTLRFNAYDLLKTTNRDTSDKGYISLKAALERLRGTTIQTNITTGGQEQWDLFGFIDSARIVRETRDGRMQAIEITLSDWLFNAIKVKNGEILTISRDYFRLRKALERRLYEIARKSCGKNPKWHFKLDTIHRLTGSTSTIKEFRRMIKKIVDDNNAFEHIPDYTFEFEKDLLTIRPRQDFIETFRDSENSIDLSKIKIKSITYDKAKRWAMGYDVYFLEQEWRNMLAQKNVLPEKTDGSFIGYIKWYVKTNGPA